MSSHTAPVLLPGLTASQHAISFSSSLHNFPASQPQGLQDSEPPGLQASEPPGLQATRLHSFFIELPYTLPQDHLLFVILREKNIDIWKRKLDWIAEKGGMALLNTHSGYMNFNGGNNTLEEYSIELYLDFLKYVKQKYELSFWNAPAIEIARFMRNVTNGINSSSGY